MSGIQSAVTDRFPLKKPTRHASILSRESPADKKQKVERCSSGLHDFDPAGLVQRCVIIQRDDNGFGLTVSGDNPVFVQSVKEDGAAMRAGVQTGDRIIKVNGALVTHSNHLEVVKLIKSGSYVALTVQGRPPGSPHIPLAENEGDPVTFGQNLSPVTTSPRSPGASGNVERITSPVLMGEENNIVHNQKVDILRKMLQKEQEQLQSLLEEYSRAPSTRPFKEIQEAKKHLHQLQVQLCKATGLSQDDILLLKSPSEMLQISEPEAESGDGLGKTDLSSGDTSRSDNEIADSPQSGLKEKSHLDESLEKSELQDPDLHFGVGSPTVRLGNHIIGAEDDDFDAEQEQVNGQCNCFQSIELLKSRPAHLAVFLHHVVSQFDPTTLLCYLYTDLYKQTNSKETRRVFLEFNQFFLDRAANLKVLVPDDVALDLEKRRPELIPEELHRHYIQTMHEKVYPDVQRHLEDFRQKRSMGLTLAENELARLDAERVRDQATLEKERLSAEHIISKIEEVLMTSQPLEEEKSSTMQYVILTYMKHLGVKVKEPRNLEQKRGRIGLLPKIKQSIKKEKENDDKVKRRVFPNILGPPRRPSRHDSSAIGRAMEMHKQRHPKHLSPSSSSSPEPADSGKMRQSESTDINPISPLTAGIYSSPEGNKDETGLKQTEVLSSSDSCDSTPRTSSTIFDFPSPPLEHLHEDQREFERLTDLGTPKSFRKLDSVGFGDIQSEDELYDFDMETDPPNWQQLVGREVLRGLKPHEIKQQEVIHELFYTERAHVRKLTVLDQVFYQRISREGILPVSDIRSIFSNLDEILMLHVGLNEQMRSVRKRNETSVIDQIGEDLLTWFNGEGEEKLKQAAATFCSNQPFALEMIKSRQKKDSRFLSFMQDAESNPLCRRLQLKDIIPTEMQRLTKYPLLLDNIAKYSDRPEEKEKVKKAADCCRQILNYVNHAVKEAENKQRLEDYQRRLDFSYLKQAEDPMLDEFRNLDLTKRKMIHEGPLTWKVNRDKTIDLYTLLLEDILVLLQKQDDKLVLRCHSKILASSADSRHIFSPIIKLNTVLVRQVATDNKALFVISMSENGAQIYELVAQTVSEKNVWQDLIAQMAGTVKVVTKTAIPLPQVDEQEEEDQQKLKDELQDIPSYGLRSSDKDLDIDSHVVMESLSLSPTTSEKPEVADLEQEAWSQSSFEQEQQNLEALKERELPRSVSQQRWATDALRNLSSLRQLLVQHLGFPEGRDSEDWHSFPACRTLSHRPCVDSALKQLDNSLQNQQETGRIPPTTKEITTSLSVQTLSEGVKVQAREPKRNSSSNDPPAWSLETPTVDLDSGAEEVGDQFFDAREAHSDDNPSENEEIGRKDEEEVQLRISGNYLILDGYEMLQESSTDDEFSSSITQYTASNPLTDCFPQNSDLSGNTQDDAGITPSATEFLGQFSQMGTEGPWSSTKKIPFTSASYGQILQYIQTIETDLEHLKGIEDSYHVLCQRMAGSALLDEASDKS
ncbi:rho guanine nucleotide exchange factor 12 isoform X2 [Microcaecilia unicolor]|uniref:Rho guanine nucleotide exchange factor 12 n=1 Tax=Microcaecilia unicolor TaxID=1415580 RepID=A0A6P7ZPI4_9AMPH|nr:rho guanine nucleotide exchange factor 12 isoform X2 [Microcaecilia unicolor]